jgi:hypothetical protein
VAARIVEAVVVAPRCARNTQTTRRRRRRKMGRVSREHIRTWLQEAKDEGATHVVVRSDDFSHDYYPVPCHSVSHAREIAGKTGNMQSTIEVYNLALDWDEQLNTNRCHNF